MDLDLNMEQVLDVQLECDFAGCIDTLVEKSAEAAKDLRQAVSSIYTHSDIGVYWNPAHEKAAIYVRPELNQQEADWCLDAMTAKVGSDHVRREPLEQAELGDWWVKVAYSPTVRTVLNALQFLPNSQKDKIGGRPVASTIATGLLGAGLGYGGGWLYEKMVPERYREKGKARRMGALIGGLGGATVGAAPGFVNWNDGRDFNDPTLWQGQPGDGWEGGLASHSPHSAKEAEAIEFLLEKNAFQVHPPGISSTMGGPSFEEMPLIKTDALGRVIYNTGVGPQTAARTMGAVYGASRMPDPRSRPGVVTPHQTGLLGLAMGAAGGGIKGYVTGFAVGKGLGLLTGLPAGTQNTFARTGAAVGVMNTLVPRLFN
jgi:hypothetical protein